MVGWEFLGVACQRGLNKFGSPSRGHQYFYGIRKIESKKIDTFFTALEYFKVKYLHFFVGKRSKLSQMFY